MHCCLQVPEILQTICTHVCSPTQVEEYLLAYDNLQNTKGLTETNLALKSLYALTRTSKTIGDVALNVLWSYQSHLHNLLRCLPESAISRSTFPVRGTNGKISRVKLATKREIRVVDLDRIRFYGRKIRVLGSSTRHGLTALERSRGWQDALLLPLLLSALGGEPLLPGLIRSSILLRDFDGRCWLAKAMLSPSSKAVCLLGRSAELRSGEFMPPWSNIRAVVSRMCPSLRSISVCFPLFDDADGPDYYTENTENTPPLLTLIQGIRGPVIIEIVNVSMDFDTLVVLARANTLRRLHLALPSTVAARYSTHRAECASFGGLDELLLQVEDERACHSLLGSVTSDRLHSLKIVWSNRRDGVWPTDDFLAFLAEQLCSKNLADLDLSCCKYDREPQRGVTPVTEATFNHITKLKELKRICIALNGQVHITRPVLDRIAQTWPHLKILDLSERTLGPQSSLPSITIVDLIAFANALPDLEKLSLRVDAKVGIQEAEHEVDLEGKSNLREVNVCTSPISSSLHITQTLAYCMPKLIFLLTGFHHGVGTDDSVLSEVDSVYKKEWTAVRNSLDLLLKSRR